MKKNDILFLLSIASVVAVLFIIGLSAMHTDQTNIVIIITKKNRMEYSLSENRSIDIQTHIVEIRDSRVRVTHATCAGKQCEHTGWVRDGLIICAPNKVVIQIIPLTTTVETDAVTQ